MWRMCNRGLILFACWICCAAGVAGAQQPPNVVLVLADDLGIGDLACEGNPWIKTPHIDAFRDQAIRLTDFHVSPLCAPSHGAILTGRYPINNGAWATFKGRDALSEGVVTMADLFKANGYATGQFGKWHLGDNYPTRPTDCGFDYSVRHQAGGVGELSDFWGNSYFDDVYLVNNAPVQFKGYCDDVWFAEAMKFIERQKDKPFFVYLPTNTPHDPLYVAPEYAAPYQPLEGREIVAANLYGMIANLDENFGKLCRFLDEQGLADNTVLIFMSDNGTRFGFSPDGKLGFNKGFRGIKGSKLEGGHRVPFYIRWPRGNLKGGLDRRELAAHIDLLPTLAALCGLKLPKDLPLDGIDLSSVLGGNEAPQPSRTVFVHHRQDWRPPMDVDQTCIMKGKWRLVNGRELYDIEQDPAEHTNLRDQHPELVGQLLAQNARFVAAAKKTPAYCELPAAIVGNPAQREIKLTIQHAIGEDRGIWKCEQVAAGIKNKNNTHALKIEKSGTYLIECRRWPKECPGAIRGVPLQNPKDRFVYQPIHPQKVRIRIGGQVLEKAIGPQDEKVIFRVALKEGRATLKNVFIEGDETYGVYYTYIRPAE